MSEDDVKGSKIAKNMHDVSLVTNIYNSFKNFKVTVCANDMNAMKDPGNWNVNLSVRPFHIKKLNSGGPNKPGANMDTAELNSVSQVKHC